MRLVLKIVTLALFLGACAEGQDDQSKRRSELQAMEGQMRERDELDTALAKEMISAYRAYIDTYPKDSLAPAYQMKIAELYRAYPKKERETIASYELLIEKYTYHREAAEGLLALALYYEEIQQKDLAIATYNRFLDRFPSHPLASQARQLMELLADETVTDIQMVEEWMRKAKDSTQNSDN